VGEQSFRKADTSHTLIHCSN